MPRRFANSNARARVSKDEDERLGLPSCFETHRSALGLGRRLRARPRCDAPQHEGRRRAAHFGRTKPSGGRYQPAAVEVGRRLESLFWGCSLQ